ncbi:hypothetical protein Tco_1250184 [Tanacetum coccineum]
MVVQHQEEMGEGLANPTDPHYTPTIIQPSISQPQKKQKPRRPKRKDTEIPQSSGPIDNVADEDVNEEMDNCLKRAATTATSLDAKQDMGNINNTQSKATPNEPSSLGTSSGGGPKPQETIGDTIVQTRSENISKHSNDPLLIRGNTLQSGEDKLKLKELMEFYTKLQQIVLDLENTKTTQAQEITSLKLRVKKLEKKGGSRTYKLKRLYKVGRSARMVSSDDASLGDQEDASKQGRKIDDIDKDAKITLINKTQGRYGHDLMFDTGVLDDEEVFTGQDMDEKDINVAEKEVSNADPVTTSNADYQMAQQMQEEEQEKLSIKEKSKLFVQLLEARKKHFETIREKEKRNKPPTKAQKRNTISKKQKLEEDKESEELKQCLEIVLDDVTIDATPLSTKSPTIVDYKIHKEGKKSFFQIIRADGKHQMYLTFGKMLKNFDREYLEVLWSIVKARFKKAEPVNYMDNFLPLNLKTMFQHHVKDNVWKNQQGLVKMFNDVKLQVDYECEMEFELLRLAKKQLKEGYVPVIKEA